MFDFALYREVLAIGVDEKLPPTVKTLNTLVEQHALHIPYQNSDIFARHKISLDLPSLTHRLLAKKQGGNCYESVELLFHALRYLKFDVQRVAAYPLNGHDFNPDVPSTHMVLAVTLDEKTYLVDPSYGYNSLRSPVLLSSEVGEYEWSDKGDRYRLRVSTEHMELDLHAKDAWFSLYRINQPVETLTAKQAQQACTRLITGHFPCPVRDLYLKFGVLTTKGRIGLQVHPHATPFFGVLRRIHGGQVETTKLANCDEAYTTARATFPSVNLRALYAVTTAGKAATTRRRWMIMACTVGMWLLGNVRKSARPGLSLSP